MKEQKVIYYRDELNDDFVKSDYENIDIDEKYKYVHKNPIWNLISFFLYRLIATPFAYIYLKCKFNIKIVGKENLKKSNGKGFFVYLNHTQMIGDAFLPTIISFPQKAFVVVNPSNVSIPFWGHLIKFLGPLPLPGNLKAWKNFSNALEEHISNNKVIAIYPEAHVWDYYTKIRNYPDTSFKYPILMDVDSYAVTVTYKKRNNKDKPQIVVYIDGPYKCTDKNKKVGQKELRDTIYNVMCDRAKNSDIEYIRYEKVEEEVYD